MIIKLMLRFFIFMFHLLFGYIAGACALIVLFSYFIWHDDMEALMLYDFSFIVIGIASMYLGKNLERFEIYLIGKGLIDPKKEDYRPY
ncbi:hypothetical protein [Enterobacillus tribolii]|uniref:Uncharacterized protein n=1 Tax=Enterobacillus tribolii TaxID=1487935 RepID=A0A370QNK1_9GAMM|nr:hypothetical protein [Enterobacillus tribolii]MBW7982023.1 hypothetical protein [Enterobacillus tribolii]RDK89957.1 hypothetical protein C8D90_106163 [Enterobacillus tribolii]